MALFTPEFAFNTLLTGNRRYVEEKALHADQATERRVKFAKGQAPFAAVLGCSDSRLPPEVILDCGLGDLFTIRTAGHVLDDAVLGSLQYAVQHLEVSLILVLGHERCGVVKAYLDQAADLGTQAVHRVEGPLHRLVEDIAPAAEAAGRDAGSLAEMTMRAHVRLTVDRILAGIPGLRERLARKTIGLVGARYDLDDGNVQCLCAHGVQVSKETMLG
jgi:carbonic anhydrase